MVVDGMVIARLKENQFWCSWQDFNKYCRMPGAYNGRTEQLLKGLVRLKMIPLKALDDHMAQVKKAEKARDFEYDSATLKRIAHKYGVSFSPLKEKK